MPKSLKVRFRGIEEKKIREVQFNGWDEFCKDNNVGPDALANWLRKQPGHENDSIFRYISSSSPSNYLSMGAQVASAIRQLKENHKVEATELRTRLVAQDEKINKLESLLRIKRREEFEGEEWQPVLQELNEIFGTKRLYASENVERL